MPKKKFWKAKLVDGLQPVMIDLEVHKAIEAARASFAESPNAILRRLLGLERAKSTPKRGKRKADAESVAAASAPAPALHGDPSLPEGAELRAAYRGVTVSGAVRAGAWEVDGSRFSLSSVKLIASLDGNTDAPTDLKAWRDWEILLPGAESWRPLAEFSERLTGT